MGSYNRVITQVCNTNIKWIRQISEGVKQPQSGGHIDTRKQPNHLTGRGQTKLTPEVVPMKEHTGSLFKHNLHHRIWSHLGIPSPCPRSRRISFEEFSLCRKRKLSPFYVIETWPHQSPPFWTASRCCQSLFSICKSQYMMKFRVFSEQFHFPRLLPLFEMISCHFSFSSFALTDDISGCLLFLCMQLYFKDASCSFQGCFCCQGLVPRLTAPRLAGNLSVSVFQ